MIEYRYEDDIKQNHWSLGQPTPILEESDQNIIARFTGKEKKLFYSLFELIPTAQFPTPQQSSHAPACADMLRVMELYLHLCHKLEPRERQLLFDLMLTLTSPMKTTQE